MQQGLEIKWPTKYDLFGVQVSATHYDEVAARTFEAVEKKKSSVISCQAVHAIVSSSTDPLLLRKVNTFQIVAPDGQPVRWALNLLYGTQLKDRVYGPELMLRLCRRAAQEDKSVYLYGSTSDVIEALAANLTRSFPQLKIAGAESPPFRALSEAEKLGDVQRINDSGAGIVFIGLGCPKQDLFAFEQAERIQAVQVCVGAAFDFHAGLTKMAPSWMQRNGLEWLFRLCQEPRRMWRRYLITNTQFLHKFVFQWTRAKVVRA